AVCIRVYELRKLLIGSLVSRSGCVPALTARITASRTMASTRPDCWRFMNRGHWAVGSGQGVGGGQWVVASRDPADPTTAQERRGVGRRKDSPLPTAYCRRL